MSIEKALLTLATSMDKLADSNLKLAAAGGKAAPAAKTETAAAKKKREAAEKAEAKKAAEAAEKAEAAKAAKTPEQTAPDPEIDSPADFNEFKAQLLGIVAGRDGAVEFTKEYLKSSGFQSAAEVPEDQWASTIASFAEHAAAPGASEL